MKINRGPLKANDVPKGVGPPQPRIQYIQENPVKELRDSSDCRFVTFTWIFMCLVILSFGLIAVNDPQLERGVILTRDRQAGDQVSGDEKEDRRKQVGMEIYHKLLNSELERSRRTLPFPTSLAAQVN
jgi:hypothetical protein